MNHYTNNPMMDMFKQYMTNPYEAWTKNFESLKSMNQSKFWSNSPFFGENSNEAHNPYAVFENFKNTYFADDTHKLSFENSQAVLRRQAEIVQKHAAEIYKLMQDTAFSHSPDHTISRHSEYLHSTFNALVADFKELVELYSKSGLESFETYSNKVSDHIGNLNKAKKNTEEYSESKQSKSKK